MQTIDILKSIGLTEKEAKVYLVLLELHDTLPSIIAKKAQLKRPTTYVVLEQLVQKGLVSHMKRNGILSYRAVDPKFLLEDLENKTTKLKEAIPELQSLNRKFGIFPQMSVFEGIEGIIQIMEDTLTTSTGLLCWANPTIVMSLLKDYYPSYVKKKVRKGIWLKGIFCYDEIGLEFRKRSSQELREVHLIPMEKFPFKNEINIYDDKVAIISHQDEVGVIIQNQNIADTQRAIFNLGFEYAKILEKEILTVEDLKYLEGNKYCQ